MKKMIIALCSILILAACSSSKLINQDEKKCPYLENKDD